MPRKLTKLQQADSDLALARLRELLKPGTTVYTVLSHLSSSGMMRVIRPIIITKERTPYDLTWLLKEIDGGRRYSTHPKHQGIKMGGTGMDMGFALVYDISRLLFPDGVYCTGRDLPLTRTETKRTPSCPSNEHNNDYNALTHAFWETEPRNTDDTTQHRRMREWMEAQLADPKSGYGYHKNRKHTDGGYALTHRWL